MFKKTLLIAPFFAGAFLVAGFMVATTNRPNTLNSVSPTPKTVVSPLVTSSPKSSPQAATTANKFNFPKASCGDKSTGVNENWYPVFADGADLDTIRHQFCADATATIRKDTGVDTVQLASFTSRERAVEFAQAVGGDVGQPTRYKSPQTKISQCNQIIAITNEAVSKAKVITSNGQVSDPEALLRAADAMDSSAAKLESISVTDPSLQEYQSEFLKMYRDTSQTTRAFVEAFNSQDRPAAEVALTNLQRATTPETQLVADINSYCVR